MVQSLGCVGIQAALARPGPIVVGSRCRAPTRFLSRMLRLAAASGGGEVAMGNRPRNCESEAFHALDWSDSDVRAIDIVLHVAHSYVVVISWNRPLHVPGSSVVVISRNKLNVFESVMSAP